jgi:hypothetical protein
VGVYAAGEVIARVVSAPAEGPTGGGGRAYGWTALACLAASVVSPYTYHLHAHIFEYLTDSFQREHIMEMMSISFQNPAAHYFEVLVLAAGAAVLWHARKRRFTECLLVLLFAHGALIASRNIPLFGIVATPVLALALAEWVEKLEESPVAAWLKRAAHEFNGLGRTVGEMEAVGRIHLVSAGAIALLTAIFYAPAPPPSFQARFDAKNFPTRVVASLGGNIQGRIFTYDQWGDFLIYSSYPKNRVFFDGRSDFYGSNFVKKYLDIVTVKYCWQQHLDEYGVDTVLLPADAPLAGALKESSRWRVVYDDGDAIVFRAGHKADGPQVSANNESGKDRDREITNSGRDRTITRTKT